MICSNAFFEMVNKISDEYFKIDLNKLFEHLAPKNERVRDKHVRNLVFGDYSKPDIDSRTYYKITDLDELLTVIEG